jgi:hypothetical protein
MSTKTVGVGETLRATDYPWQDDGTYNLLSGAQLDLVQIHSKDTINFVSSVQGPGSPRIVNLTSLGGDTTISADAFGTWSGNIRVFNGTLTTSGGSHSHWTNTGDSIIAGDSYVHINAMTATGGSMELNNGGKLEWTGALHSAIPVTLDGGTLIEDSSFGSAGNAANVTFRSQNHAHMNEVDLQGAFNAASWSMKDDLLQVFNASGSVITSIANFHNTTGKPIQVDQTATGVAVIADATPRPGMLVGHIA